MHTIRTRIGLLALGALAAACTPDGRLLTPRMPALDGSSAGVPFAEDLASPEWQQTAASLVAQAAFPPHAAARVYALLGVAQYLALQEAEAAAEAASSTSKASPTEGIGTGGRSRLETDRGAVAGASAVLLSYLFPSRVQTLEDMVIAQGHAGPGEPHPAFTAAEAIGRAVGAEMVTRAQTDGFNRPFTGTIPTGAGLWTSNTNPATIAGGQLPSVIPWFLTSPDQFRPAAPPAFGSGEFQAALGEIRAISDTRTAEQVQIATFWAQNPGTPTPPGFWLGVATDEIRERGLSEREATHIYALVGASMFDALIGCWDAKETYWFIRPWQADPAITVVPTVGKPNHPSYPSGHSCVSNAAAVVLARFFPAERPRLDAMATEAGLSRMYAGIHYRFDIEAGGQIGRSVAAFAIAADASGNSVLTPHTGPLRVNPRTASRTPDRTWEFRRLQRRSGRTCAWG